ARRLGDGANMLRETSDPNLQGHELDWQALHIESPDGEQVGWEVSDSVDFATGADTERPRYHKGFLKDDGMFCVISESDKSVGGTYFEPADASDRVSTQRSRSEALEYIKDFQRERLEARKKSDKVLNSNSTKPNIGARIMYYRARLARLT